MAGHGYTKLDPAIERWNYMREDVYRHFRFTPRTTIVSLCGVVIIPGALLYLFAKTDRKWDWRAKRKAETLSATSA